MHGSELIVANTDRSIKLIDLNNGEQAYFDQQNGHKAKIECLKYGDLNQEMSKIVISGGEDKVLKFWDRTSGKKVNQTSYGNMPFYSVDTNKQVIAAGTSQDLVFWDIRNLKGPMEVLDESHAEDITCI